MDLMFLDIFARTAGYERPKIRQPPAFVSALIQWRKLNSWRKNTELFDNHKTATERLTTAEAKTTSPDVSLKAALEAIAALDINQLSLVEALTKLYELQRRVIEQPWI